MAFAKTLAFVSRQIPTQEQQTHSFLISSALFGTILLSNKEERLQSHRAKQHSVSHEFCFPSGQPMIVHYTEIILTDQDSLQQQIYE